jgi:hypothetical protein
MADDETGEIVVERDQMGRRATEWCWRPMSTGRTGRPFPVLFERTP